MTQEVPSCFPDALLEQARKLLTQCREANLTIATAESCTGGLLSTLLTEIMGSSSVFMRGYVTYTNDAKAEIGVPPDLFVKHGAVSEEVARAMAESVVKHASTGLGVGITGIAGPDGGSPQKPVGTVHIAVSNKEGKTLHEHHVFNGPRGAVRMQSVETAMKMLAKLAK